MPGALSSHVLASEHCAYAKAVSLQVQSLHSKCLIAPGGPLTLASLQGGHVQTCVQIFFIRTF